MSHDDFDNFEDFQRKDTENELPIGWVILFVGLIVWGVWYLYSFTPAFTGWSQEKVYLESIEKDIKK